MCSRDGQMDGQTAFSWLYRALRYMKSHCKNITNMTTSYLLK